MQNIIEFTPPRPGPNWKNIAIVTMFHLALHPGFFYI